MATQEPAEGTAPEATTFALMWYATLNGAQHQDQLVKTLLIANSLFVIFGESNSGKTFFILDLALAIAAGLPWCGLRTQRGLVIYVAGEGAASVRARVAAYRKAHPEIASGLPFAIVPFAVDFLNTEAVTTLIATVKAAESLMGENVALVIVDTLARAMPGGDENSTQDMGGAVASADRIRLETGAAVGFVHHAGKDPTKGARGSSALRAATDTEILIEGQTGPRSATVTKQRDLESGQRMIFELVSVEIGTDPEEQTLITSCVVRHCDGEPADTTRPIRELKGKAQRQLLAAVRAQTADHGNLPWTLGALREVARKAGMSKSTARYAVDALSTSPYMTASVGGYLFTDGLPP